jgi:hypothetical protein
MKKAYLLLTIAGLIFRIINIQAQEEVYCSWMPNSNPSAIDSMPVSGYNFNEDSKVWYRVLNDDNNIYLLMKFDRSQQMGLLFRGQTVWISPGSKTKKKIGIKFPTGLQEGSETGFKPGEERKDPGFLIMEQTSDIELIGFDPDGENRLISSNIPNDIHGKLSLDKMGQLSFHLVMPLLKIIEVIDITKGFSLGIESGQVTRPSMHGDIPPPDGMGEDRGRPEGGMGNGRPDNLDHHGGGRGRGHFKEGERNNESGHKFQPVDFWIKNLQLSKKK